MVKLPGRELSLAFGASKDNLRLLKHPSIICLYGWRTKEAVVMFLPLLYVSLY